MKPPMQGLMLAAPASGSGKTTLTLGLLRALKNHGIEICAAKAGPDYIDPGFHALSCGSNSVNLDPWAMHAARLKALASAQTGSHLLVEAMMGLFDGAADGTGSAASLAKMLGLPVILIIDAAKQSHSIAALVRGFRDHDPALKIAGVILNKVGSTRHEMMLRSALGKIDMPVLGCILRDKSLELPERHLGLIQAHEVGEIEAFIENAAKLISNACDMEGILSVFQAGDFSSKNRGAVKPLGDRIAIAKDRAFSFIYPHLLEDWYSQGASISFFSPLNNEAPESDCDAVYLPGGYPELHCETLSGASSFIAGMKDARDRGAFIYGECGGYMVLGESLIDANGKGHTMSGLLALETSFEKRKLHLGYRKIHSKDFPLGGSFKAHEFHYTSAIRQQGTPLFQVKDAMDDDLGNAGLRVGNVMGSYMHIIDEVTL